MATFCNSEKKLTITPWQQHIHNKRVFFVKDQVQVPQINAQFGPGYADDWLTASV